MNEEKFLGNSGVGSAEEMNRDIQLRQSDPNYVANQIEHTNNVIKNRQSEGLDITAQLNYLNKLKGNQQSFAPQGNQGNPNTFQPDLQGTQMGNFNPQTQQQDMMNNLQMMSQAQLQQQKAMLDAQLNQQIMALERAYAQAIQDGKISVRDAKEQFDMEKKEVERQAYLDAERTQLYSQEMGIQNSQQMVGLMQGDNARTNELHQTARLQKERRINDISDRLNRVKQDVEFGRIDAQNQHQTGMAQSTGAINAQMYQNMFDMQRDEFNFQRNQQGQLDMMNVQNQYNMNTIGREHELKLEQMAHAYNLDLGKMKAQTRETLQIMEVNHGYDVEKMAIAFQQDLKKMATQHGYSASLQSQAHRNAMAQQSQRAAHAIQQEERQYQVALGRALSELTPGTPEYKVAQERMKRESDARKASIWEEAQMTALISTYNPNFDPKNTKQPNYNQQFKNNLNTLTYFNQNTSNYTTPVNLSPKPKNSNGTSGAIDRAVKNNYFNY